MEYAVPEDDNKGVLQESFPPLEKPHFSLVHRHKQSVLHGRKYPTQISHQSPRKDTCFRNSPTDEGLLVVPQTIGGYIRFSLWNHCTTSNRAVNATFNFVSGFFQSEQSREGEGGGGGEKLLIFWYAVGKCH